MVGSLGNLSDGLHTVDVGEDLVLSVVIDDGHSLFVESVEAAVKGFSGVILAVHEGLTGDVVHTFNLRRAGGEMVRASGGGMYSTSFDSIAEEVFVDFKVEDLVNSLTTRFHHLVKSLGLAGGSGESVKHDTAFTLGHVNGVIDKSDNKSVRHELSGLHDTVGFLTEGGVSLDSGSEHISGGQMADTEFVLNHGGLSSLTGTGRSNKDHVERGLLGALISSLDFREKSFG